MKYLITSIFAFTVFIYVNAQPAGEGNTDEAKVGRFTLPDVLLTQTGKKVKSTKEWERIQRPYVLHLLEQHIYGKMPGKPAGMHYKLLENSAALEGTAIRKQITIYFSASDTSAAMNVILYLPKTNKKIPVFIGLNFLSNPSIDTDTAILRSHYTLNKNGVPVEVKRGEQSRRWPIREILNAGFGVATAYYQDIEPDNPDGWKEGVRGKLKDELGIRPGEWGAIGAWAWGLSRIQDYLETDPAVDAKSTIVTGHSRLGKAALWAGAHDQRFAIVISNNSGEAGAALARRDFGETIARITQIFPYWFISKYSSYAADPTKMPVDQHMLLSLIAPRPIYVASAFDDKWADPKGEFLLLKNAEVVYNLYKLPLLGTDSWPAADKPVGSNYLHYHMRTGKHDIILYDWKRYIDFAKKYLNPPVK